MLPITKSDFLEFRHCAKAFWLKRDRPDEVAHASPSAFERKLMTDGYAVEEVARRLVASWDDSEQCRFQVEFVANGQLLARVDLIRERADGSFDLYEIKSSTSLKGSTGDHIADACFQQIVVERAGAKVRSVHVIHVNKEYVRVGEIDPASMLTVVDVSEQAASLRAELEVEIEEALTLIAQTEIDENGCTCRYNGSADNRCASYSHFNQDLPERSAHLLPRISSARLKALDTEGRLDIHALTTEDVTAGQLPVWTALTTGQPVINRDAIAAFLENLKWPLHFYDYETFASAVPIADGYRPHSQIPVQFSLHKLHHDGTLDHFEFLADGPLQHGELVDELARRIDPVGSGVVWFESFEKGKNRVLAELHPKYAAFLEDLNARTVDLMAPFKADYVHPEFLGSTSIKKVLPVLCPDLSYEGLPVHDGTGAMDAWNTMVGTDTDEDRVRIRGELLAYCKLDTWAMVRIFEFLSKLQR